MNILSKNGHNVDIETDSGYFNRDIGSTYLTAIAAYMGVDVIRIHDALYHQMAKSIGSAIRNSDREEDTNFEAYSN